MLQGRRFSLSQQVLNFENTLSQLRTMMNGTALDQYLARSIAILVFGSNDYIHNYLMPPFYTSSFRYRPVDYANLLLNRYTQQILVFIATCKKLTLGLGLSNPRWLGREHVFLYHTFVMEVSPNIFVEKNVAGIAERRPKEILHIRDRTSRLHPEPTSHQSGTCR